MRKLIACLAATLTVGTTWIATAEARPRMRNVYCHYQTADGRRGWSDSDVHKLIQCTTNKWHVDTGAVLAIADRESGLSWWARNSSSGACGIMQHLPTYWPSRQNTFLDKHPYWTVSESCLNARANVAVAVDMIRRGGFGPWS